MVVFNEFFCTSVSPERYFVMVLAARSASILQSVWNQISPLSVKRNRTHISKPLLLAALS